MPANNEMNLICCFIQLDSFGENDVNENFFLKISKSHISHNGQNSQM